MINKIVKFLYWTSEFLLLRSLEVSELGFKIENAFDSSEVEEIPTVKEKVSNKNYNNINETVN